MILLGMSLLSAQEEVLEITVDTVKQEKSTGQKFLYDMGNVFGGMGFAYSRPLHWEGKQWKQTAGVLAGTALLFLVDEEVHAFGSRIEKDIPQWVQDYGWYYGSPQNNYMATGAVYLTGLISNSDKLRRTGVLLLSSASAAGLLQQVSKYAFGRARPRSGDSNTTFRPFEANNDYHSFPSGHAILAFTNAYAIAKQFGNPWVKGGILFVGAVPGLSRIWESAHWISDVALSFAISIATVEAIDRYLDRKYDQKYNDKKRKVDYQLTFRKNQIGVVMMF
ncbi:MAG: phosphatase PAP2 family protein [Capnocytophaga sp.]|nr:phosphatase PAP2 family protein [Capnocytophaga sp.]